MYRSQATMPSATVKTRATAVPNSSRSCPSRLGQEDPHSLPSPSFRLQTVHTNTQRRLSITVSQSGRPLSPTPAAPPSRPRTLRLQAHRATTPGMLTTRQSSRPRWSGSGSSNNAKITRKLKRKSSGCSPNSSSSSSRGCGFSSSSSNHITLLLVELCPLHMECHSYRPQMLHRRDI